MKKLPLALATALTLVLPISLSPRPAVAMPGKMVASDHSLPQTEFIRIYGLHKGKRYAGTVHFYGSGETFVRDLSFYTDTHFSFSEAGNDEFCIGTGFYTSSGRGRATDGKGIEYGTIHLNYDSVQPANNLRGKNLSCSVAGESFSIEVSGVL